jgi:hypothetical protein
LPPKKGGSKMLENEEEMELILKITFMLKRINLNT